MMDLDPIQFFIAMIIPLFWFSAAVGVTYEFIRYISRETGAAIIWRRIFESIVLLMSGIYGWDWIEEPGTLNPVYGMAGRIIVLFSLMAFVYSSYRKNTIALWIDIAVNCFLLAGFVFTIFYAVSSDTFGLCVFLSLPVNILFIQALLVNYNLMRANYPQRGKKVPSPAIPDSNIVPNFSSAVGRLPDAVRGTNFSETTTDTGL
jgi:hypothetical protein